MSKLGLRAKILYFLFLAFLLHMTIGLPINLHIPKSWKEEWKKRGAQTSFEETPEYQANERGDANRDKGKGWGDNPMMPPEVKKQLDKTGVSKPFELKK